MNTGSDSPTASGAVDDFACRHSLLKTPVLEYESAAIHSTAVANVAINQGVAGSSEKVLNSEPALGILLNLLHRIFEHVEAALVAFVTGSGATAEVASRTAVEASASVLYILSGDCNTRLLAFLRNYLQGAQRQTAQWQRVAQLLSEPERSAHLAGVEQRRKANDALTDFVGRLARELSPSEGSTEIWPQKTELLFASIGEGTVYRTAYARMCSQTHGDAEETLRYVLASHVNDSDLFEKMALETVLFSRLMVYYGVLFLMKASSSNAKRFGLLAAEQAIAPRLAEIESVMRGIAMELP